MDSDVVNYLLSFNLSPNSILTFFCLTFLRLVPLVAFVPYLGAKVVPMIGKIGLAVFLALLFMPTVIATAKEPVYFNYAFLGYSLKEVLIGVGLAFLASIPFYAVEASGILVDYSRGSSSLMGQNVLTQDQASPLGIFFNYVLIYFFFMFGGVELFFNGVVSSFEFLPVNQTLGLSFHKLDNAFWKMVLESLGHIFALSIRFASPALVAILMAEVFLGIANRLAPQVQIAFLGIALKSLMGLGLLMSGWAFILKNMVDESLTFAKLVEHMIDFLKLEYPIQ